MSTIIRSHERLADMLDTVTRLVRASAAPAIAVITGVVGILALASVVPAGPAELLALSLAVMAAGAGVAITRTPFLVPLRVAPSPAGRRRAPMLLDGRVTDTKRSPVAPRAPGLV